MQHDFTSDAAIRYLSSNNPHAILAIDPGLTRRSNSRVLDKVSTYVQSGSVLVFCCIFTSFINRPTFSRFMRSKLNFPWEFGEYLRVTVRLNERAALSSAANRQVTRESLPQAYSQKAVHLKDVESEHALYLPDPESARTSCLYDIDEAPVAFRNLGQGTVGYIGDVIGEEG